MALLLVQPLSNIEMRRGEVNITSGYYFETIASLPTGIAK
jgi:hypothetical protein